MAMAGPNSVESANLAQNEPEDPNSFRSRLKAAAEKLGELIQVPEDQGIYCVIALDVINKPIVVPVYSYNNGVFTNFLEFRTYDQSALKDWETRCNVRSARSSSDGEEIDGFLTPESRQFIKKEDLDNAVISQEVVNRIETFVSGVERRASELTNANNQQVVPLDNESRYAYR